MPFGLKNASQIFQRMMDNIFGKYSCFFLYSSRTYKHLELIFEKLISHGLIVSKKKLKLFKT